MAVWEDKVGMVVQQVDSEKHLGVSTTNAKVLLL
jgi:hypothetical protein